MLETLASWNLAPWEVPGDGDCLFTSSVIHILDEMKVYTLSQNCDTECNQEQVLETLASWNLAPWEVPGDGDRLFTSSAIHILDEMKVYTLSQNCDAECNQEQVLETLASWNLAPWEVPGDGDRLFTSSVIHILDEMNTGPGLALSAKEKGSFGPLKKYKILILKGPTPMSFCR